MGRSSGGHEINTFLTLFQGRHTDYGSIFYSRHAFIPRFVPSQQFRIMYVYFIDSIPVTSIGNYTWNIHFMFESKDHSLAFVDKHRCHPSIDFGRRSHSIIGTIRSFSITATVSSPGDWSGLPYLVQLSTLFTAAMLTCKVSECRNFWNTERW